MKTENELKAQMREAQTVIADANKSIEERQAAQMNYNAAKNELETLREEARSREVAAQNFSLTKHLRENKRKEINVREALTAGGLAGKAVEQEMQQILEPLYAGSVLETLGNRHFSGVPMGDITIPVMGKGTARWKGETAANQDGTPAFGDNITLKPHRLTTYFEISEQMLLQDTIGVNNALLREAVNCLRNEFEATVFGDEAGTENKPAGILYGKTLKRIADFKAICDLEASIDDANVGGSLKYIISNKAKADLRNMAKSSKSTQLVMEGGSIDGTPATATSLVASTATKAPLIYGNWQNLITASWADLILKVDDSVSYENGLIRVYVTGYFDAKVARPEAFAFGDTRATA